MSDRTRILCVDDERNVLRALERIFLDDDYDILTASSGEQGLEMLNATPQIQVVISDFRMPGMNGVEFLKEVFKTHPDTIRLVLSGYADTAAVVAAINEGKIYKFIPKPWNDDELRLSVTKALETFAMRRKNAQLAEELRLKNEELSRLNSSLGELVEERTRELLEQNRALLRTRNVLKHLPVGVVGIGTDGTVLHINGEAATLLGVKEGEVTGKSIRDVLPPLLHTPPGTAAAVGDACCWQTVTTKDAELHVNGVTVVEDGEVGVILTILRAPAGCRMEKADTKEKPHDS